MKYQSFTYKTKKTGDNEWDVIDSIGGIEKSVCSTLDFEELLNEFGFDTDLSMDTDFDNTMRIELINDHNKPIGYLQRILD